MSLTLQELFSIGKRELSPRRFRAMESNETKTSLRDNILREAKTVTWGIAFSEIVKGAGELLNINLGDIFASGWNKHRELVKTGEKSRRSPNETFLVSLSEHKITSVHHPYIEVLLNDRPIGKIDFEISALLTLNGIVLKIRDGTIREILAGSCKAKGTVSCEKCLILEKETKSWSLPGSIDLGGGIPLKAD